MRKILLSIVLMLAIGFSLAHSVTAFAGEDITADNHFLLGAFPDGEDAMWGRIDYGIGGTIWTRAYSRVVMRVTAPLNTVNGIGVMEGQNPITGQWAPWRWETGMPRIGIPPYENSGTDRTRIYYDFEKMLKYPSENVVADRLGIDLWFQVELNGRIAYAEIVIWHYDVGEGSIPINVRVETFESRFPMTWLLHRHHHDNIPEMQLVSEYDYSVTAEVTWIREHLGADGDIYQHGTYYLKMISWCCEIKAGSTVEGIATNRIDMLRVRWRD